MNNIFKDRGERIGRENPMENGQDFNFHRKSILVVSHCQLLCTVVSWSFQFFFNFEAVNCCMCFLLSWKKLKVEAK